ncbi:arylsulfatase [Lutibacter sp. A80]|uniref:arylsulfatase n=1 Tax=Lutibacter sp. A80 TaxID=2918453 RepID=UPI001F059494|nr:arylsulfatase [Lutibacter sp. A80]UMB62054.1 arylsulfatase [Lutibacter sp. A80]
MKKTYLMLLLLLAITACDEKKTAINSKEAQSVETNLNEKPNIILILADDLGKGLLSKNGQEIITTPNIDKLAKEGISFSNAYTNMLCAPSRASLITGLHDSHANKFDIISGGLYKKISAKTATLSEIEESINSVLKPIGEDEVFLGTVAQEAGYKTGQIGKLEWGFSATDAQMKRHGWDYYYGYLDHARAHGFYPPYLFENGKQVNIAGNLLPNSGKSKEPETPEAYKERHDMTGKKVYSQNLFMEKAFNFITENKDAPFFLYFPTQLPHGPVSIPEVHADFINDDRLTPIEKEYASMVKMLDDNVGQIMQKLKDEGIAENTIVIFASDNGHEIYYGQEGRVLKPYTNIKTGQRFDNLERKYYSDLAGDVFDGNDGQAGMKRSNLQGGITTPLIFNWPNKIKPGTTSDRLIANYDMLATIAEITGFNKPVNTDGISYYNELFGGETKTHEYVVYSSYSGPTLITNDGWKIRTILNKNVFEIYYLPDDYREENELSKQYPDKLKELKEKLLKACDGDFNNGLYSSKNSEIRIK